MSKLRRVFVMRHAESLEDIDKDAYVRITDANMPLTSHGREQAAQFGRDFGDQIGVDSRLHVVISPSKRVLETAQLLVDSLPTRVDWSITTDSLISKQNWGDVTADNRAEIEKERYRIGVLRYRFPNGESGAEMLFRFDLFVKQIEMATMQGDLRDLLVITHGFGMRVLLKSMLGWSEEYFESLAHPRHCECKRVAYVNNQFTLLDEMRIYDKINDPNFTQRK